MEPPDAPEDPGRWSAADPAQRGLIARVAEILGRDARVLGVWLVGSFARGTNDRFSDVDLWVVVATDDFDGFCADWPRHCDEITPTVFRRRIGDRPIFNQITPDWLRFDVTVGTPDAIATRTRSTVVPLLDPHGLSAGLGDPARRKSRMLLGSPRSPSSSCGCWGCCRWPWDAGSTWSGSRGSACCGRC